MKKIIILYIFLFSCTVFAQSNDIWNAFWNKDTTKIGFKDKNGVIKIEPKFTGFTIARKFENIIAVTNEKNNDWESYYLTKTGKIIGRDSLYVFDNGPDCENEGFIRFRDPKTDKMGMFNGDGKIAIPAEYSNLTKVKNGMFIGLKDAKKEMDGEHFFWKGGKEFLIDINNKILVENFKYNNDYHLNYFSVEKAAKPSKDETRESFRGIDEQYYSFINFEKEFRSWLKNNLLSDLAKDNLLKHFYQKISYSTPYRNGRSLSFTETKTKFINKNYKLIKKKLLELTTANCDYSIFIEGLNPYNYAENEFSIYFNNCNEAKDWKYPVMDIVISPKNKTERGQDHLEFLRTENGYKLISVSLRKDNLK
ncbi:hypothetical protein [Flavobacterium sp. ACN6]|uniref:hypothetical protein n=1 Tax=Flavobacterium sp. ACN6 TaxID=1920426 RepID=UPI000BB35576|nr:hypothetical protein [Flavobacterium sp. ACN6]PBJ13310.1 hypothetical protein BSF42_17100 [Flavobacterium sp. ACN6]